MYRDTIPGLAVVEIAGAPAKVVRINESARTVAQSGSPSMNGLPLQVQSDNFTDELKRIKVLPASHVDRL